MHVVEIMKVGIATHVVANPTINVSDGISTYNKWIAPQTAGALDNRKKSKWGT